MCIGLDILVLITVIILSGDPNASEITMSNEELANILIRVKEGTMNQDDAVKAVSNISVVLNTKLPT